MFTISFVPFTVLVLLVAIFSLAAAIPFKTNLNGWVRGDVPPSTGFIRIWLAVAQREGDSEVLRSKFLSVSDPKSADYTQYWTRDELSKFVQANETSVDAVSRWLEANNLSGVLAGTGDLFVVSATVRDIERAFSQTLFTYTHPSSPESVIVRSSTVGTKIAIPRALSGHVDFVFGLNNLPDVRLLKDQVSGFDSVTPELIRKLYNISTVASGKTKSSQALAEFQEQSFSKYDLSMFERHFKLEEQAITKIHGPNSGFGHTEANLDVQYIIATGEGVDTRFWLESSMSFDLLKWVHDVLNDSDTSLVWSVSYGEALSAVTPAYAKRLNSEFMKMATLGISILFASGDSGICSRGVSCSTTFQPSYPASLPAVTAVGATTLSNGQENSAASFSGGGFSLPGYFDRATDAPWQVDAVNEFFKSSSGQLPPSSFYNQDGVGFPDVSALGVNFEIFLDFVPMPVSGTSASCPTFAGIVGLLNDERLNAGKKPLGFLNPFLFQYKAALKDIVLGDNASGQKYGFKSVPGWDPVTGLGTPNYALLKAAALK